MLSLTCIRGCVWVWTERKVKQLVNACVCVCFIRRKKILSPNEAIAKLWSSAYSLLSFLLECHILLSFLLECHIFYWSCVGVHRERGVGWRCQHGANGPHYAVLSMIQNSLEAILACHPAFPQNDGDGWQFPVNPRRLIHTDFGSNRQRILNPTVVHV